MRIDVGSYSQDLAHQAVELLREVMSSTRRFSLSAVAHRNVEVAVVFVAGPGQWVKNGVSHRMIAIKPHSQKFACSALEGGIPNVGVGPFNEDRLKMGRAGRRNDRRRGGVPIDGQGGQVSVRRDCGP